MQRCLLFACVAIAWVGASAHAIADNLVTPNGTDQTPATHGAVGRFVFAPYGESLVLLDTATGVTWILKRDDNSEKVWWSKIGESSRGTAAAARNAPSGRVDLQTVPEQRVIILRGAKGDVTGAQDAIRAIASEPSNFSERIGPTVTVVALKSLDPADTAAILTKLYKETPDIIVEALPKMKCIAIRADENTTKGISELLGRLEEAQLNGGKGTIKILPLTPSRPDLAIPDEDNRTGEVPNKAVNPRHLRFPVKGFDTD